MLKPSKDGIYFFIIIIFASMIFGLPLHLPVFSTIFVFC